MAAFSLDSFDLKCQRYALKHGFSFVNDISANAALAALAGEFDATYCLMHGGKQGGANNSNLTCDIMGEVDEFFERKIAQCEAAGAKKIVLDIGVGFGKDAAQGLALIKNLSHFSRFEKPLLVGASRKSLINAYYPSEVSGRLAGTLFLHQKALENGAAIIRVHDVKEHAQMMKLSAAYHEILG
jgi:dihydropteroate synthase